MAKKEKAPKAAPVVETPAAEKTVGVRGPKGVDLSAEITVLVSENPKRQGSASYARFELYKDGMTVEQALQAGIWTADLIYDTAHNFVAIAGYTSPKPFIRKERAAKADKPAKAPKAKKVKAEPTEAQQELAAATQEETID